MPSVSRPMSFRRPGDVDDKRIRQMRTTRPQTTSPPSSPLSLVLSSTRKRWQKASSGSSGDMGHGNRSLAEMSRLVLVSTASPSVRLGGNNVADRKGYIVLDGRRLYCSLEITEGTCWETMIAQTCAKQTTSFECFAHISYKGGDEVFHAVSVCAVRYAEWSGYHHSIQEVI